MLSVFQVFKLIFGIIVSATVLFFLLQYAGIYRSTETEARNTMLLKSLRTDMRNSYLSGNSLVFSGLDFEMAAIWSDGLEISYSLGRFPIDVTAFFSPGKNVFIHRGELDYSWWKFYFVEAMPSTKIIFVPYQSENVIEEVKSIASFLPETAGFEEKVSFSVCSGSQVEQPCGERLCERQDFIEYLSEDHIATASCTAAVTGNYRLVNVGNCQVITLGNNGICVDTVQKRIYIPGAYLPYSDYADIAAVIIGGTGKNLFSGTEAQGIYAYKNTAFRDQARLAARLMESRTRITRTEMEGIYFAVSSMLSGLGEEKESIDAAIADPDTDQGQIARLLEDRQRNQDCTNLYFQLDNLVQSALNQLDNQNTNAALLEGSMQDIGNSYGQILASCDQLDPEADIMLRCAIKGYGEFRPALREVQSAEDPHEGLGQSRTVHAEMVSMGCDYPVN